VCTDCRQRAWTERERAGTNDTRRMDQAKKKMGCVGVVASRGIEENNHSVTVIDLSNEQPQPESKKEKKVPKPRTSNKKVTKGKENDSRMGEEEEDDGDDFVKAFDAKKKVKDPKVKEKVQSKLVKVINGDKNLRFQAERVAAHDPGTFSADYVIDNGNGSGGFDEFDVKINKLRVELRDAMTERSMLEARERKIRKDIKALEKKQNESLINRSLLVFAAPGEDRSTESEIAQLFPMKNQAPTEQEAAQNLEEVRRLRASRPYFDLASSHSQSSQMLEQIGQQLETNHCFLMPLTAGSEPSLGGGKIQSVATTAPSLPLPLPLPLPQSLPAPAPAPAPALAPLGVIGANLASSSMPSTQSEHNEMTIFSQLLAVMDEAGQISADDENQRCDRSQQFSAQDEGGICHNTKMSEPVFMLEFESQHLENLFKSENFQGMSCVFQATSAMDRGQHWQEKNDSLQEISYEHALSELLSKFSKRFGDIFSSVTLSKSESEIEVVDLKQKVDELSAVNGQMQQLLVRNEMVLSELNDNLEALSRVHKLNNLQDGGSESKFIHSLRISSFAARVLSDAALFASNQSANTLNALRGHCTTLHLPSTLSTQPKLLHSENPDQKSHFPSSQPLNSESPAYQMGNTSQHSSPYIPNEWDSYDGIVYGGASFYDPDEASEFQHDGAALDTDIGKRVGAADDVGAGESSGNEVAKNTETIDLITPDSQPWGTIQINPTQPQQRIILVDSTAKKDPTTAATAHVPRAQQQQPVKSFFSPDLYALGECPDFSSLSQVQFELNCAEIGIPSQAQRETALSCLKETWIEIRNQWLASAAAKNGKNKRNLGKNNSAEEGQQIKRSKKWADSCQLDDDETTLSKHKMPLDLIRQVVRFIEENDKIYENILLFRPISLDELHSALHHATPSITVAKEHLKALLDSQAIFVQQGSLGDKYAKRK